MLIRSEWQKVWVGGVGVIRYTKQDLKVYSVHR